MISKIKKYPNVKDVQYVKIDDYTKCIEGDYLNFTIPNQPNLIKAKIKRSELSENGDYVCYARFENCYGEISLIKLKDKVFGSMSYQDNIYRIYGIGKGLSAILTLNDSTIKGKCALVNESNTLEPIHPFSQPEVISPCLAVPDIRILCYYTDAADNKDPDVSQTAVQCINDFRNALDNSGVSMPVGIGFELKPLHNFVEQSGFIERDIDRFATTVQSDRVTYHGDICVLLTDGNYDFGNTFGQVKDEKIPSEKATAFAIVEVEDAATPSRWVFTHELGHMFGGRHQGNGVASTARGMPFDVEFGLFGWGVKRFTTIMHTLDDTWLGTIGTLGARRRVLQYSNPNINYFGVSTGNSSCCNVAQEIELNALRIAGFESDPLMFSATIIGQSHIFQSGTYYWEPNISCGNGPYRTKWDIMTPNGLTLWSREVADDGLFRLDFYPFSTLSQYSSLTIRMTVQSSDNQTRVAYMLLTIDPLPMMMKPVDGNIKVQNTHANNLDSDIESVGAVFPNPTTVKINFDYILKRETNVKIAIVDSHGREVKSYHLSNKSKGYNQQELDISSLPTGIYMCRVITDNSFSTQKFSINK